MRALSGGRFAWTCGWRIAVFAAAALALPQITAAVIAATHCSGATCAAVLAGTGTLLLPALLVLLALALVRPSLRRASTVGLPAIAGLSVPVLFLLDGQYLTTLRSQGMPSFSLGLLNSRLPFFAILALLIILALVRRAPATGSADRLWRRLDVIGKLDLIAIPAAILAGVASAGLYAAWFLKLGGGGGFAMMSPLLAYAFQAGRIASMITLVAMAATLWIIVTLLLRRNQP